MFCEEIDNAAIGEYLRTKIAEKYKSVRQFCIAYIELKEPTAEEEGIQRMQNRFTQILKGKKAVQTYDLPVISDLLGMSCEEILSAGKSVVPTSSRVTNYDIAYSRDPDEWKQYIEREDKLFLNSDEYGKTVLDYAFDFKNYGFLKYLVEQKYISFVLPNINEMPAYSEFGAETSIKRREIYDIDVLASRIRYDDSIRTGLLSLAIENDDFDVLERFHARETPMLYQVSYYANWVNPKYTCDPDTLIDKISKASDRILTYYSKEYEIHLSQSPSKKCLFLYQYLGQIIERMINREDKRVKNVLDAAIKHNQRVKDLLDNRIRKPMEYYMEKLNFDEKDARKAATCFFTRNEKCSSIKIYGEGMDSLVANVVQTKNVKAFDKETEKMIEILNASANRVLHFGEERK